MKLKKDVLKGICIGMALSFAVGVAIPAYAATKKQLDAVFSGIKIIVDGNQLTPKDGAGKAVEPFIVDGTTYLPVRAVAEAIGKPVTWDSATQTVYLGEVKNGGAIVGFDTLKPYNISNANRFLVELTGEWKVRGVEIPDKSNAIAGNVSKNYPGYGEYALEGNYTKLVTKIGIADKSSNGSTGIITFYCDGVEAGSYQLDVGGTQDIEINLIGVKTLKVEFQQHDRYNSTYPVVYNAKFYPID